MSSMKLRRGSKSVNVQVRFKKEKVNRNDTAFFNTTDSISGGSASIHKEKMEKAKAEDPDGLINLAYDRLKT